MVLVKVVVVVVVGETGEGVGSNNYYIDEWL